MVPKFQVATACFSCSPLDFKLIKVVDAADLVVLKLSIKQSEIQNSAV
jgi:hypothetical protein